ncbi:hypothetical protein [Rhodovulum marinum]|uniref:YpeB-like protein with protease inhibitory function n=1 Tax=Rhodovulum marinum TaxID=320662 RepID=A0A4R2Q2G5_9RHOB|nr:hypothetical protein [Rhodovulum marinum]TCP40811.1 hypothetical protein EV662_10624 [Rhodovulum marinum]
MIRPAALALLAALTGVPVMAQSQLARDVLPELRRAGVSQDCISRLSQHDFAAIKGIRDSITLSPGNKLREMKFRAERGCGETRSFIFDIFN